MKATFFGRLARALAVGALGIQPACADDLVPRVATIFWGALDLGYGSIKRSLSVTGDARDRGFSISVSGGYSWQPNLLVGMELNGWTLENSNLQDSNTGEGLEMLLAVARYYPIESSPLFVKVGVGGARYWSNHPGQSSATGSGFVIGAGYEIYSKKSFHVSPYIEYGSGYVGNSTSPAGIKRSQRFNGLTFKLGVLYR